MKWLLMGVAAGAAAAVARAATRKGNDRDDRTRWLAVTVQHKANGRVRAIFDPSVRT